MKSFLCMCYVLLSLSQVFAADCFSALDVQQSCLADLTQKESTRFGKVRVDSVKLGLETLVNSSSNTISCYFTYASDVSYRGGNFVVRMIGMNKYLRTTCEVIDSSLVIAADPEV